MILEYQWQRVVIYHFPSFRKFVDQAATAVPAQELWIRNGMWNVTITNTCHATGPPRVSRRLYRRVSHRGTIRRGITARGKLIVRYNSHNSKHLKCQPELIVAMRSCDEAECGESYPNKSLSFSSSFFSFFLSLPLFSTHLEGLIRLTKAGPAFLLRGPHIVQNSRALAKLKLEPMR